jgi:hypothetical protein
MTKKKEKTSKKPEKCSGSHCGGMNLALPVHSCPYQADVNNDDRDYCTCCDTCADECAMDI